MKRTTQVEHHACGYIITGPEYGPDGMLVQTDWEYPSTARDLGWNMRRVQIGKNGNARFLSRAPNAGKGCDHMCTDGTITCDDCGVSAKQFIAGAAQFLSSLC